MCLRCACVCDSPDLGLPTFAHKELLKSESPLWRLDCRPNRIIGCRQDPGSNPHRRVHAIDHFRQVQTAPQEFSTGEVRGKIPVAEPEPGRHTVSLHLVETSEWFVFKSPAA